jgi:nucleotide-binding universal stress UspA family protein
MQTSHLPTEQDKTIARGKKIMVGYDHSKISFKAVQFALSLCTPGDTLHVFTFLDPAEQIKSDMDPEPFRLHTESEVRDIVMGINVYRIPVEVVVKWTDDVRGELLTSCRDFNMVVVGQRGVTNFVGVEIGSVSEYLVHHSPVPVVVVR